MGGAFLTSRDIFKNSIWNDVIKFRLFFFIVGNAVFAEEGVKVGNITLKRGQFLRSYRNLAEDLQYLDNRSLKKYSISVLKKKVDQLVIENRLKIEDTELGTLFTVVNYAMYQDFDHYKKGTENGARTPREQPENNNKKVNKVINEKEKIIAEIKNLRLQYSPETISLIDAYWQAIKKTRKTNQVSYSVILKTMKQWTKYGPVVVQYSLKKHIEAYDDEDHDEKYTLGIMRNTSPEQAQDLLGKKSIGNKSSPVKPKKDIRDIEIAYQRWIEEGKDPDLFNWITGKGIDNS